MTTPPKERRWIYLSSSTPRRENKFYQMFLGSTATNFRNQDHLPMKIQVSRDPTTNEPRIANPVMKGAVPDYKATALALAGQLHDAVSANINHQRDHGKLYASLDNFDYALRSASKHWTASLWPTWLRNKTRLALGQQP